MDTAPIATVETYEQLLQLLRARMVALDSSYEMVEVVSGIGERYLNRVLGPNPTKGIGPVTFSIFGAWAFALSWSRTRSSSLAFARVYAAGSSATARTQIGSNVSRRPPQPDFLRHNPTIGFWG